MTDPLLAVRDLSVQFDTPDGTVHAVDGVDVDVRPGETVCLVGESGSGKTVLCESVTRLVDGATVEGSVEFDGTDVLSLDDEGLRRIRGSRVAHVFQNPQGALDPVYTIGEQLREAVERHTDRTGAAARRRVVDLLDRVGIPRPAARLDDYPHEFSGGMRQRVVIAMALAGDPDLLVADEPTTALDVTIQASVLDLLSDLQDEFDMAVLFVTHDLGVVAEVADRVVVLYAGEVMERGAVSRLFRDPAHPYTRALFRCLPGRGKRMETIPGTLPDPTDPPDGCRFHPRCEHAVAACRDPDAPAAHRVGEDHDVACVHYGPDGDADGLGGDAE